MTALALPSLLARWQTARAFWLATVLISPTGLALALEATPDDPIASTQVPNMVTEITQKREQNAVTSVRVKRGDNVYHITPSEQVSGSDSGGRAATWEIFQFNSSPAPSRSKPEATPPALR